MYKIINNTYGQILFSFISALLLIISSAGFGISYTVFIAFIPLFFALRSSNKHPVMTGLITGFLYYSICLSWMMITFGYFGGAPIPAAFGLLIFISILGAFFFFVPFTYTISRYTFNPYITALLFTALEAVKGKVFFGGVPWLNLAQSQYNNPLIIQSVSIFGEYGLSFIIMLINIFIYNIITSYKNNNKSKYILLVATVIVMVSPGIYRLINPIEYQDYKTIAVIQPGYNQEDKWNEADRLNIIYNLHKQLINAVNSQVDLIVMPESSYPAKVLDTPAIMDVLEKAAEKTPVILGTERRLFQDNDTTGKLYNTMVLIDKNSKLTFYDKRHLTPFGEYFPFITLLRPVKEFFFGKGTMFSPGNKASVLVTENNIKAGPVICFESAFSQLVRDSILIGANMFVVISNDTWFGKNQGRVQHLAVDVLRTVEYGRATARATQDGISAFILPDGSIPLKQDKQIPDVLIYKIPLTEFKTFFSIFGNIWIAFIIPLIYYQIKKKKSSIKYKE